MYIYICAWYCMYIYIITSHIWYYTLYWDRPNSSLLVWLDLDMPHCFGHYSLVYIRSVYKKLHLYITKLTCIQVILVFKFSYTYNAGFCVSRFLHQRPKVANAQERLVALRLPTWSVTCRSPVHHPAYPNGDWNHIHLQGSMKAMDLEDAWQLTMEGGHVWNSDIFW